MAKRAKKENLKKIILVQSKFSSAPPNFPRLRLGKFGYASENLDCTRIIFFKFSFFALITRTISYIKPFFKMFHVRFDFRFDTAVLCVSSSSPTGQGGRLLHHARQSPGGSSHSFEAHLAGTGDFTRLLTRGRWLIWALRWQFGKWKSDHINLM